MSERLSILTSSAITINRVAALLEESGIACQIRDNTESARLAGFGSFQNDVELFVDVADAEKAQEVIADFFDEEEEN